MGDSACQIIITEGNNAYAATEIFADRFKEVETAFLQAAIQASCTGIIHASLHFTIEGEYNKLTAEYTHPIIELHERIVTELPLVTDKHKAQPLVNDLTKLLMSAIRAVNQLFD